VSTERHACPCCGYLTLEGEPLCPNTDDPGLRDWFEERVAALDEAQRRACGRFLRFMVDHAADTVDASVALRALKQYWHRYDER